MGASGAPLGGSWALLGRSWDALGALMGYSWGALRAFLVSWRLLASILVQFGRILGGSGEGFGTLWGRSWKDFGCIFAGFAPACFGLRFLGAKLGKPGENWAKLGKATES